MSGSLESYLSAFARIHLKGETVYEDMLRGNIAFPSAGSFIRKIHYIHHEANHVKLEDGTNNAITGGVTDPANLQLTSIAATEGANELDYTDVLEVSWNRVPGEIPYIEYNSWFIHGQPWNLSAYDALSFRAAWTDWHNWWTITPPYFGWFEVELISGGHSSVVSVNQFDYVPDPYRHPNPARYGDAYNVMTTIRIPLRTFLVSQQGANINLSSVDAVRLYFYSPLTGELYLDDVEFSR